MAIGFARREARRAPVRRRRESSRPSDPGPRRDRRWRSGCSRSSAAAGRRAPARPRGAADRAAMCGRYSLAAPNPASGARALRARRRTIPLEPRFNIAPGQDVVAVTTDREGAPRGDLLRWGLVPFWADSPKVGYKMINARAETLVERPAFRDALATPPLPDRRRRVLRVAAARAHAEAAVVDHARRSRAVRVRRAVGDLAAGARRRAAAQLHDHHDAGERVAARDPRADAGDPRAGRRGRLARPRHADRCAGRAARAVPRCGDDRDPGRARRERRRARRARTASSPSTPEPDEPASRRCSEARAARRPRLGQNALPMQPVLLIANPTSGGGKVPRLLPARPGRGSTRSASPHRTELTRDLPHARELTLEALALGELPVAFSGDGVAGAVAAAAARPARRGGRGAARRQRQRLLPPRRHPAATRSRRATSSSTGRRRRSTSARPTARRFLGIASLGFDSEANAAANAAPRALGRGIYVYGALSAIARWKPASFEVETDGGHRALRGLVGDRGEHERLRWRHVRRTRTRASTTACSTSC